MQFSFVALVLHLRNMSLYGTAVKVRELEGYFYNKGSF